MANSIFDNPYTVIIIVVAFIAFVIYFILRHRDKLPFVDFKPQKFSKTIYDELKSKLDTTGIKIPHASIFMGYKKIGIVECYKLITGKFSHAVFDEKTSQITVDETKEDKTYQLMLMRSKSNTFFFRILGMRKYYFILQYKKDDKKLIAFDTKNNSFFIDMKQDLVSYGNVWTNSQDSIEYINDISMKRMTENAMMHVENIPDKVVHLELEQAKRERTGKLFTALEKSKYEERKRADETLID